MSNMTQKLRILNGNTADRNTVLEYREPTNTARDALSNVLPNNSYSKPFLIEDLEYRSMRFVLDGCTQSEMRLDNPEELVCEYTRKMMGFLLFRARPKRLLMIGLGGGSLVKYCHRYLPETKVTTIEIDPEVIALRSHFCIPPDDLRLQVIKEDGARYVAQMAANRQSTDVLLVDAYDQFGIARAVVELAFLENAKRILGARGIFVMNLVVEVDECDRHVDMIRSVFGDPVIVVAIEHSGNRVVFAGNAVRDRRCLMLGLRNAERVELRLGLFFPTLLQYLGEYQEQLGLRSSQCA